MKKKKPRKLHQIRVSDLVYAEIQARAVPLVDNPDMVLRRIFRLPKTDPLVSEPLNEEVKTEAPQGPEVPTE